MASRRVLSHLLRSTSRRSKPAAFSSPRPPSPAPLSRPSPAGFLLSRAVQYATSAAAATPAKAPVSPSAGPSGKITDEFTGAGSIGKVCHVKDIFIDVRFDEGMPPKLTTLEVLDNSVRSELMVTQHLGNNMVRTIQVYGTEDLVRGQRVLNTGSPFFGLEVEKHYDAAITNGSDESTATTQPAFATFKHATRLGLDPPRGSRSARRDTYTAQLQKQIQTLTQESVTMRQQLDTMRQQWEADRARLASLKTRQREIEQFMADYMARGGDDNA